MKITIGKLVARLGDGYYDTLEVEQDFDTKEVTLELRGYCPRGGMDGDPTPQNMQRKDVFLGVVTAPKLAAAIKQCINVDSNAWLFKRYGKASRHFVWYIEGDTRLYGLNAKNAKAALTGILPEE